MTLLVVHNNTVYVDNRTVIGDAADYASKIITIGDAVYASAGNGETAQTAVFELSRAPSWFDEVTSVSKDDDHTCIVARIQGALYILDLAKEKPRFSPMLPPNKSGLQFMAGSGWRWFHAYYHEHNDVDKAMRLTGKYCRDVTETYESFSCN